MLRNAKDLTGEMSVFFHHVRINGVVIIHYGLDAFIGCVRSLAVFATRDDNERRVI
jgi:hypothetical protein